MFLYFRSIIVFASVVSGGFFLHDNTSEFLKSTVQTTLDSMVPLSQVSTTENLSIHETLPTIHEKKGLLWRRWFFSKILIKSLNLAENPYKIPKFGGKTNYIQKIGRDIISRNSTFFMYWGRGPKTTLFCPFV